MKDFKIEYINGEVKIVRQYNKRSSTAKHKHVNFQSIRVQCFDSNQVDRIMKFQQIENERRIMRESNSTSVISKIWGRIKGQANKLK